MNAPPDATRLVLGIDPGVTGAVALAHLHGGVPRLVDVADIPTAKVRVNGSAKSHLLLGEFAALLRRWTDTPFGALPTDVWIEDVHAMPGQGVTSMFRFGQALGQIEGVCAGLGLVVHKISPKEWQALARARKDPDAGRHRASQLFPALAGRFARKLDHNRADAALLAYAGALRLARD